MTAPNPRDVVKPEEQRYATDVTNVPTSRARRTGALVATLVIAILLIRGKRAANALDLATDAGADAGATTATAPPTTADAGDAGPSAGAVAVAVAKRETTRGALACKPIRIEAIPGQGDRVHWWDATCHERTALLVPPDHPDSAGSGGGYVRDFSFDRGRDGATVTARGTDAGGWRGFGYVVAHYARGGDHGTTYDDAETKDASNPGVQAVPLVGANHLLYRFRWRLSPGAPVDVTVDWLFATGRDHPLYSITYDARPAGPGVVRADSRAPYGDIAFEGDDRKNAIGGVGWGDKYRFVTTSADATGAMTRGASWDYREANMVPFDRMWSAGSDAEMGLVGTARWSDKPQGGDYGPEIIQPMWGTIGKGLPIDWAWPYQIDQYELPFTNASHRLAWGLTFGAVGQPTYDAFGRTWAGYPFQSYAVHVVLGAHLDSDVLRAAADAEAELGTEITASRGRVSSEVAGGPGRTDLVTLSPAGWDSAYAVWSLEAGNGAVNFHLKIPAGHTLDSPMIRVHNWTGMSVRHVRIGRESFAAGDILGTVDSASKTLWLTIPRILKGDVDISIE